MIIIMLLSACDDILEDDITNDTVQIISPMSGTTIEGNTVQFAWNDLDGADTFRIQIVNDLQINVLDSLITTNTFNYILNAGDYEWRVRGENFAYNSAYSFPADFSVELSVDLTNQILALQTPSADLYTNNPNVLCTWNSIESADDYTFELLQNLNGLQTIHQEENIATTSFSIVSSLLDEDAEYIWKVKAVNSSSETSFAERSFFLDRVIPNQPSLVSPTDMTSSTATVNFNWTNGADSGNVQSTIINTIEIANDIDFNSVLFTESTANNSFQYTFDANGTYYWKVKAVDAASNEGDYSIVRSVIVE